MINRAIIYLLLFQSALFAQQDKKQAKVNVKVDLVSLAETIPNLYLGKKEGDPVDALAFRYDKTIKYRGSRIILINQSKSKAVAPDNAKEIAEDELKPLTPKDIAKAESDSGKNEVKDDYQLQIEKLREKNPDLVGIAKIPEECGHITILLTPATNNTYRAQVMKDDPRSQPYGRMSIYNFCKHPIQLKFAKGKPVVLKNKSQHEVKANASNTVSYLLSYPKNKKWKPQESNIIRVTPDQQVRMIVLNSKSSFFKSASGSRSGRLQVAILTRDRTVKPPNLEDDIPDESKPKLKDGFQKK